MVEGVITLIKKTYGQNSAGAITVTESSRDVFCTVQDIRREDFYASAQIGIPLSFVFKTNPINYDGEDTLIYEGFRYGIKRTYTASLDVIELYAGLIVGENKAEEVPDGLNEPGQ